MMHPFVKEVTHEPFRVLLADASPVIRSALLAFPETELVVRAVVTDRAELVRAVTRLGPLDAVLCSDQLSGRYGGVRALDELRGKDLLAPETAFILMSGEASKADLMLNIEAKPDGLLLKPFKPAALLQKLTATVQARRALAGLHALARQEAWEALAHEATHMLTGGTPYVLPTAQLKASALRRLGQAEAVMPMFQAMLRAAPKSAEVLEAFARHAYDLGETDMAERTLERVLELQPANVQAADLLATVKHSKGDSMAAQLQLQAAVRQSPHNAARHRALGHLAVVTGDTATAHAAYRSALKLQLDAEQPRVDDAVNLVRSLLLHGDPVSAWRAVGDARKRHPDNLALLIQEDLVDSLMHSENEAFGRTQRLIADTVSRLIRFSARTDGALMLAATEACLMARLPFRAFDLSEQLLAEARNLQLHPAQMTWAEKLHSWSRVVQGGDFPKGLLHYRKFMSE